MTQSVSPTVGAAWHHELAGGLRKRPLQERSRAMIQRVLDTAAALVEEVGYEAVVGSPTLLLDRSGISRGSFYAFFETPERVLDELSYQRIRQSAVAFEQALRARRGNRWIEIVDIVIDFYTAEHRVPLIRELWVRQNLTHQVRQLDHLAIDDFATIVLTEFRRHTPLFASLTELQCRVAMHAVERLFQLAFTDDPEGDPATIAEARRMLADYFAGYSGE
ncbi:TetR/AcrR family transcriptional regulator [Mycolicibacterium cosmeticum]|uniref:TetR/AcrR family transcriptional regulator n=1 Tax=Mycolicibacterium cosmeticum TaxID=258533 RepID=UPI0032046317